MFVTRLHHSKCHVSIATVIHATIEELWEAVLPVGSIPRLYHEDQRNKPITLESNESAVCSWETDTSEVITDCCLLVEGWEELEPNTELVVRQMPASKNRSHGTWKLKDLQHWEC
jgi:hypothetical protein